MQSRLLLALAIISIFGTGCGGIYRPSPEVPQLHTATSSPVPAPSIDVGNPATWPRYSFRELGFSIQLPFERDTVHFGFSECRNGRRWNGDKPDPEDDGGCAPDRNDHSFFGSSITDGKAKSYFIVGAISPGYAADRDWDPSLIQSFHREGPVYRYGDKTGRGLVIHPLRVFNNHGRSVVVWDELADYWSQSHLEPFSPSDAVYGIAVELGATRRLKAAEISLVAIQAKEQPTDPLLTAVNIAKSIEYDE